ncbi:MAG TPA: (d)CMP kinase [Clostridiales bacterium]|nr:(d)CMP kinase [Clostridiales bacterium]
MMGFVVAVDGPAGSGKGTITKLVGEKRNLVYIDTGAMYRCVTLDCINNNVDYTDIAGIEKVLDKIAIELKIEDGIQKVYLNGKDVSQEIREDKVNNLVSEYSAVKEVRDKITPMQQEMGKNQDIIMEGRDIGTVVFPNADVKIFLDCDVKERARRRYIQNQQKGINSTYEEILENIIKRERINSTREVAPFIKAEDAILIDSTNMTIEEVVNRVIEIIDKKKAN